MTRFRMADPATRFDGPKPTDHDLPVEQRTRSAPYLVAIVVVLVVGIALVAFAVVGLTQSTTTLENSADAVAPAERLAPETTGSLPASQGGGGSLDREIDATGEQAPSETNPELAVPGSG
jgi:hypothetical protein